MFTRTTVDPRCAQESQFPCDSQGGSDQRQYYHRVSQLINHFPWEHTAAKLAIHRSPQGSTEESCEAQHNASTFFGQLKTCSDIPGGCIWVSSWQGEITFRFYLFAL